MFGIDLIPGAITFIGGSIILGGLLFIILGETKESNEAKEKDLE